jgi:hypothetical protein
LWDVGHDDGDDDDEFCVVYL